MASVPLAALAVRPVEAPDSLAQYGKLVALKSMLQNQQFQQQIQPLQLEAERQRTAIQGQQAAMQQQQMAMQLHDQQMMRQAADAATSRDSSGKVNFDYDRYFDLLHAGNVSPDTIDAQVKNHQAAVQSLMAAGDEKRKQSLAMIDDAYNHIERIRGISDPQQRAQAINSSMRWLQQNNPSVTPDQLQDYQNLASTDDGLKQIEQELGASAQVIKRATDLSAIEEKQSVVAKNKREATVGAGAMGDWVNSHLAAQGLEPTPQNVAAAQEQYNKETKINPGVMRAQIFAGNREYAVYDPTTGQLRYANPAEINKLNQTGSPLSPAAPAEKAIKQAALIEDIRGNINSVRDVLANPNMPEFTAPQRAQIAIALGGSDPQGALSAALRGGVMGHLTDEQQHYLINLAQLKENAMAMRAVLGTGQGSEDMRRAISNTIPSPQTPTKKYAAAQLDAFEKVLNRLEKGIPNVPLADRGGSQAAQSQTQDPLKIRQ